VGADSSCTWENQVALGDNQVKELKMFGGPWAKSYAFADTIIGIDAGNRSATVGAGARVVIGYGAGTAGVSATDNLSVIIGYLACNEANGNRAYVAIGDKAGQYGQNAVDVTLIGSQSGRWLGRHQPLSWESPDDETHVKAAGADVTQGLPLPANVVGHTAVGKNALRYNTIGQNNTGFGDSALGFTTTGQQNVAIGYVCGEGNVIGSFNCFGGQGVRAYMRSGDHNALWGYGIGAGVGSFGTYPAGGSFNTLSGSQAGYVWAGSSVSGFGYKAFFAMTGGAGLDVGVGFQVGQSVTTGGSNTFLGANAGNNAGQLANVQNSIAIGAGVFTTASNEVKLGNASNQLFWFGDVSFTRAQLIALKALV
jgi:hypothetical protein